MPEKRVPPPLVLEPDEDGPAAPAELHVEYSGFVHVNLQPNQKPTPQHINESAAMFEGKERIKTQKLHPLFCRGFKQRLTLKASATELVAVEPATGKSLVNIPVRRIGCVGVFDRLLFVVGRRPGGGKYNCHRLECHDTPAAVEAMAVFLAHASKTAFVFDLGSPRLAKRSFLPTLSPRTRRKRSEGRTSSSPLSGRSPHGSPLGSPSPLRRSTSPAHTPVQVHPPTLSAALAHEIVNPRGDRPSKTGSDVGSGDLLSPSRLSVSSSAGPASPRDEPTAAASLLSEFGFGEVDVEIDEAMLDDPDGGGQYGWFPVEAVASQGVRDELSGLTATDRWISDTDLSAHPEDHAVAGPAECSLCLRSTTSGRERWVCMKNCECSFHETCLELWRCDGHNVCPNCSAPISLMKFYGRLLGKHMSPRPMTPENSETLIREGCTAVVGAKLKCVVNLKINAAHLRFEGVSGDFAIRFKRAIEDVVRVDLFDNARICVTFVPDEESAEGAEPAPIVFGQVAEASDDGHVLQFFGVADAAEGRHFFDGIVRQLEQSGKWAGTKHVWDSAPNV
eukprot:m.448724 g.448724  ORF g.448724 m.448724 type:complete len:563 (-) comp19702_c0_seq1:732-2420(-)